VNRVKPPILLIYGSIKPINKDWAIDERCFEWFHGAALRAAVDELDAGGQVMLHRFENPLP